MSQDILQFEDVSRSPSGDGYSQLARTVYSSGRASGGDGFGAIARVAAGRNA